MGLLGTIVIAIVISSPSLCQRRSREAIASLVQNLLSNPQLLKMAANKQLCNQDPYGASKIPAQYVGTYQNQYVQRTPTVIEMPYPPTQQVYQTYPVQAVPVKEVYQAPQVTQQVETVSQTYTAPSKCPLAVPAAMVNPFLPAASPMSALVPPTSSLLPPANPNQFRSNYLRKIPIPPPCM